MLVINDNNIFRDSDDIAVLGAEDSADFGAVFADEGLELGAADTDDGLGVVVEHDNITSLECPLYGYDAAWQKTFVFFNRLHCAFVNDDCPGSSAVENPSRTIG